jgi:hypothetical protein
VKSFALFSWEIELMVEDQRFGIYDGKTCLGSVVSMPGRKFKAIDARGNVLGEFAERDHAIAAVAVADEFARENE